MTSVGHQKQITGDTQQRDNNHDEHLGTLTTLTNVPLSENNEMVYEQQIVHYNSPVNFQTNSIPPFSISPQQVSNNLIVNQLTSVSAPAQLHHQQQQHNMCDSVAQQVLVHSNTNQQQVLSTNNRSVPFVREHNVSREYQHPQPNRSFSSNIMPNIPRRGPYHQRNGNDERYEHVQPGRMDQGLTNDIDMSDANENQQQQQQPSWAARRFATTHYPFAPFSVIFKQDVSDKKVVDELIKHASDTFMFELKTVAYRRGRSTNNDCRILIFVENSESFSFLYDHSNWPNALVEHQFIIASPSIPPQLSLVLPVVPLQTNWEEFVQELKSNYPGVVNIIRLKNKAQQPVRTVKLELLSATLRNDILATREVSIMHMKFKVVEYFSQANVLICSNCYGIGHFRKNCPQANEATCRICGEKSASLNDHQCSGVPKCLHCGGAHASNDIKCGVVKDYRAALTRDLLSNVAATGDLNVYRPPVTVNANVPQQFYTMGRQSYATAAQMISSNMNDVISKKLDAVITKVEEESAATRRAMAELKDEIRNRCEEAKQQVDRLENTVVILEKKYNDLFSRTFSIIQNICTSILDPRGSQSTSWKTYWQEQIKSSTEIRSSLLLPTS